MSDQAAYVIIEFVEWGMLITIFFVYIQPVFLKVKAMATREQVLAKVFQLRTESAAKDGTIASLTTQLADLQKKFDALNAEESEVIQKLDAAEQSAGDVDAIDAAFDAPIPVPSPADPVPGDPAPPAS